MKSISNFKAFVKAIFMIFLIMLCFTVKFIAPATKPKWCWTKSMVNEPSFTLNAKNGGMNWGYCVTDKKEPPMSFYAIVTTSNISHSETSSEISIQLFGDKGKGNKTILNKDGFDKGMSKKIKFKSKDVGDLQKIKLFLKGQQSFRCKNITIIKGSKRYNFHCLRSMAPCTITEPQKCMLAIPVDGYHGYKITIETGDGKKDGTKSPIHFTLVGDKANGQRKVISEKGLKAGSSKTFTIYSTNIGKIMGFIAALETNGDWRPTKVTVNDLISKERKTFDLDDVFIVNPGNSPFPYIPGQTDKKSKNSSTAGGSVNPVKPPGEKFNIHDPNGGLMPLKDKKKIIELKCNQVLKNPDDETILFGPDYPTQDINYTTILARCPSNCHNQKNVIVYGLAIHPAESPICPSAIVDQAISLYGGIFQISLFAGRDKYEIIESAPKTLYGFKVKKFESSKKSFVVAKIDNIDQVKKDIRIVDGKGKLSAQGRLEMRYEGVWGTICSLGNNRLSAKIICRDIGYKDGQWKSPAGTPGKSFCTSFNDEDHCGAKVSKSLFSKITCSKNDNTFNKCLKQLADPNECGHDFDAIISCYNNNYDSPVIIPSKNVRLEASKKQGNIFSGRLEMYFNNKYAPVCNIGFNVSSAQIACKQMGFLTGKPITNQDKAKSYQLSTNSKKSFNAVLLSCKGQEAVVGECKMTLHSITCKHDQDVVVECEGPNGDVTGKSQYIKREPVPPPKLSKLGITHRTVNCVEKGYDTKYRGDPGSIYLLTCPSNCGSQDGMVWGTGVYTSDSYICLAALHSGVIGPLGGQLLYIKTWGQKIYFGSSQNGGYLSASAQHTWPSSFSIAAVTDTWKNMLPLTQAPSFLEEKETQEWSEPEKSHFLPVSYREHNNLSIFPYSSSFLEVSLANNDLPKPLFKWIPPTFTYLFKKDTNNLFENLNLPELKDYTIIFNFKLIDFKKEDTFLFSYPGCGGFNIYIGKQGILRIGDFCNRDSLWTPGYNVPFRDNTLVYIRYKDSRAEIKIKSEKVKNTFSAKVLKNLDIAVGPKIGLGRLGSTNTHKFLGSMMFFFLFKGEVPISDIPKLLNDIKIKNANAAESFSKTVDNRLCVSRCSDNPVPPNPGCGQPPKEADLNGSSESANPKVPEKKEDPNKGSSNIKDDSKKKKKNEEDDDEEESGKQDDQSKENESNKGKSKDQQNPDKPADDNGTYDKKKSDNIETNDLNCKTNLLEKRFSGSPGKIFRCKCPNCSGTNEMVYGSGIYHPKSSICRAAQHSGKLKPNKSGEILVTLTGPKPIFNGSEGDDKTESGTFQGASTSFKISEAQPLTKITCSVKVNQDKFANAPTNQQFVVLCPKKCSKKKDETIYGSETYTDDSSICIAAIHRGIINDIGGEVKFVITVGKDNYKGTNGFGIASKEHGPHVRSFSFLGTKSAINYGYDEDFQGKFADKYQLHKHPNPRNPNSDSWDFYRDPKYINAKGEQEPLIGIRHTGFITANNEFNYGSWVTLRNAEWANGTVRFNFLLKHPNPIAFFFRYKDRNNYYAVQFDQRSPINNVKLITRVEGNDEPIETKSKPFELNTWYRIKVDYNYETVKVFIQSNDIREMKSFFNKKLIGLHRGTIGFATKGNNLFILNGIKISKTEKPFYQNDDNRMTWKSVLKQVGGKSIRDYCSELFLDDPIQVQRCSLPHIYCRYQCDKFISKIQAIINYACYQDCVREGKVEKTIATKKKDPPVNFLTWVPKLNDKCDYKPSGEKVFVNCVVKGLSTLGKKKFAQIEYKVRDGTTRAVHVEYPNINLLECGKGLKTRKDCPQK